jgi:hypothetical protein
MKVTEKNIVLAAKAVPLPLFLQQIPRALPCRYWVRRIGYFENPATLRQLSSIWSAAETLRVVMRMLP